MGTVCSSEKVRISPTISTCDLDNNEHPLIAITQTIIQNMELIGELETAPLIVQQYSQRLQKSSQYLKVLLQSLEIEDCDYLKLWNQLVKTLDSFSNILKETSKSIQFQEQLPIISYNLQEIQKELETNLGQKKGKKSLINRTQSSIIQTKVIRIQKRHQTDKI